MLVVVLVVLLTALALAGAVVGDLVVAHRRAAAAADLAALAGAHALSVGGFATVQVGSGCDRAARVARENDARMTGCDTDGREIVVGVAVDVANPLGGTWAVPGVARAGPAVPAGATAAGGSGP